MDISTILFVVFILSLASFIQSATGFGLALVCLATLPMVLAVEEGIALVTLFNLVITCFVFFVNRSGFDWKKAMPIVIGGMIGIPIGFFGLKAMDGTMIIRILGVVLVVISLNELLKGKVFPLLHLPEKTAVPIGILAGVLGGAFNVGGPPIVVYTFSRRWSKEQAITVLQSVFLAMGFFRLALMIRAGDYTPNLGTMVLWSTLPAIGAVFLGKKVLDHFPPERLKTIVFVMILGLGLFYAIRG
jgi:uncharacterized membrane protein YfcA